MEPIIAEIERKVNSLIAPDPSLFVVEIRIKPTNNVKIYIDGDQGVGIDQLTQYNRRLYRQLEEEGLFPGNDFSLELSSPGLDEPLKMLRQYKKNKGRFIEVILKDGEKKEGRLTGINEQDIIIEETTGKGKKQEIKEHSIPFETIKATKVQIKF
jgi:ribosome maturation factor RimP